MATIRQLAAEFDAILARQPGAYLRGCRKQLHSEVYLDQLAREVDAWQARWPADARVLDFGCGDGHVAFILSRLGYKVDAVDVAHEDYDHPVAGMRAEQAEFWPTIERDIDNAPFFQFYTRSLPFDRGTFDAVVAFGVLEHVPADDLFPALAEIRRVTRAAGTLHVAYLPRRWAWQEIVQRAVGKPYHATRFTSAGIRHLVTGAGFHIHDLRHEVLTPHFPTRIMDRFPAAARAVNRLAHVAPFSFAAHMLSVGATKEAA